MIRRCFLKSDESAFQVFKKIYKAVTDTDFTFSMDNLQDILKNPKLADNRFLIPLFIRLRIYKQMGFIKTDIPYLFPPLNDPVTLL